MANSYSYEEMVSIADNIMGQCKTSSGQVLDTDINTPQDVSRIMFTQYTNAASGELKLFLYSRGRTTNNKPYIYNKRLSRKKYNIIMDMFDSIFSHDVDNDSDLDDLIIDDF